MRRSRGWVYTVWTDGEKGRRSEKEITEGLLKACKADSKIEYAIFGYEETKEGRKHLQGFVYWTNAVTGKGAQRRLGLSPGEFRADAQRGTHQQASDYCAKDENIAFVHGTIPDPADRKESAWDYILAMIENGASDWEIMREYPAHFARCKAGIGNMRMELLAEKLNTWRDVTVEYIWGTTGAGKTRGVLESVESPQDVYRVTDYKHPFDNYRGQSVLLLEEFRSSLPIEQMLIYLDGYYCQLPCRYSNKFSGWDKIFIVTNIPLEEQYRTVQERHPETWAALERRIHAQVHMGHQRETIDESTTPFGDRVLVRKEHQDGLSTRFVPREEARRGLLDYHHEEDREWRPES